MDRSDQTSQAATPLDSLQFPPFSRLPGLVELLNGLGDDASAASPGSAIGEFIAAAGFAIGLCWADDVPLAAGPAPSETDGDEWRTYGAVVADEVQALGWRFADLGRVVEWLTAEVTANATDLHGAAEAGKNS